MRVGSSGMNLRRLSAAALLAAAGAVAAWGAEGPPAEPGPRVEVTLKGGAEKFTGFLLEFQGGKLRFQPEGIAGQQVLLAADIEALDFAPPAAPRRPEPPAKVGPPPPGRKKDGEPKGPEEKTGQERTRRWREFLKKRAEERLTPEERVRFLGLLDRFRKDPQSLTPEEQDERLRLHRRLGLLDPDQIRRLIQDAMRGAEQAQRDGKLDTYIAAQHGALRAAETDDQKRRGVVTLFAAGRVQQTPTDKLLRDIAEDQVRATDQKVRAAKVVEAENELQAFYALFEEELERPLPRGPRPPGGKTP